MTPAARSSSTFACASGDNGRLSGFIGRAVGSTFKRPAGYFAGKLIEDAGLKGFSVGGAQVSKKHAGFVINTGSATAADIWNLCNEIQNRVQNEFGVTLEMEIQKLGSFEQQKTKG